MLSNLTSVSFVELVLFFSSAVLLIGLLVSYCIKDHSARAHQVLLLTMLGAVCVPCIHRGVTFFDWGVFGNGSHAEWAPILQVSGLDSVLPAALPPDASTGAAGSVAALSSDTVTVEEASRVHWTVYVSSLWCVVTLLLLTRLALAIRRTVTLLREAEPLMDSGIEKALSHARQRLEMEGPVRVLTHESIATPSIWCWQDVPVLLMPKGPMLLKSVDWTAVVCHELAHYRRKDHVCDLTAEILLALLPWHPLLWLAKRRLVLLSEQACDDWVLSCGREGTEYADSLLTFQSRQRQAVFAPAIATSSKGLARRVRRILAHRPGNPRIGRRWTVCMAATVLSLAIGLSLAQEGVVPLSPVAPPVDTERLIRLGATPPEEMTIERLAEIIEAMESAYVNIHISYEWYVDPPLTLDDVGPGMGITIGRPRHELLVSRPFPQKIRHYEWFTSANAMMTDPFDTTRKSSFNGSVSKRLSITDFSTPVIDGTLRQGRHFLPPVSGTPLGFSVLRLNFNDPEENVPLSSYLTEWKDSVRLTKTVSHINGFDCIHIVLPNRYSSIPDYRLYFSVNHGYTPVRTERFIINDSNNVSFHADVNSFQEVLEGLWFPSSGTLHIQSMEGRKNQYRAIAPIVVNQRLSEADFDISFTQGAEVNDEVRGRTYLVKPTEDQRKKFDRNQRALREHAAEIDKAKEPGGRLHSMSMLRQVGQASGLYFGDNEKALPATLDDLRHYLNSEVLSWVTDNVILLTLDHLEDSAARAKAPLAYDKTLLKEGNGTTVLYGSGIVRFLKRDRFDALGIEVNEE